MVLVAMGCVDSQPEEATAPAAPTALPVPVSAPASPESSSDPTVGLDVGAGPAHEPPGGAYAYSCPHHGVGLLYLTGDGKHQAVEPPVEVEDRPAAPPTAPGRDTKD